MFSWSQDLLVYAMYSKFKQGQSSINKQRFLTSGITLILEISWANQCFELEDSLPQPAAESSSLPSGQSLSPSQSQRFGTQAYDPGQLNSPGAHVTEPERKKLPHVLLSEPNNTMGQIHHGENEYKITSNRSTFFLDGLLLVSYRDHLPVISINLN